MSNKFKQTLLINLTNFDVQHTPAFILNIKLEWGIVRAVYKMHPWWNQTNTIGTTSLHQIYYNLWCQKPASMNHKSVLFLKKLLKTFEDFCWWQHLTISRRRYRDRANDKIKDFSIQKDLKYNWSVGGAAYIPTILLSSVLINEFALHQS